MYKLIILMCASGFVNEINDYQYRAVAAWVSLRPMIVSQVREAFSDNVIDRNEFNAIRKAFDALDCEYRADDLAKAKKRLREQLEKQR